MIPLLSKSEISSPWPSSVAVQPGLCRTRSETRMLVCSRRGSYMLVPGKIHADGCAEISCLLLCLHFSSVNLRALQEGDVCFAIFSHSHLSINRFVSQSDSDNW